MFFLLENKFASYNWSWYVLEESKTHFGKCIEEVLFASTWSGSEECKESAGFAPSKPIPGLDQAFVLGVLNQTYK